MKQVVVHLPQTVADELRQLVEKGIFLNVSDAVRTLLTHMLRDELIEKLEHENIKLFARHERTKIVICKMPPGLLDMIDDLKERLGFSSRSAVIRQAIVDMALKIYKLKEES